MDKTDTLSLLFKKTSDLFCSLSFKKLPEVMFFLPKLSLNYIFLHFNRCPSLKFPSNLITVVKNKLYVKTADVTSFYYRYIS